MGRRRVSTGVTQGSLFEEYYPSTEITTQKANSLKARIGRVLEKEGLYNFAKLAEEALVHEDNWIKQKYGVPKEELRGILNEVFGEATNYSYNIEDYLTKVREVPNDKLWTKEANTLFDDKEIHLNNLQQAADPTV